MSKRLPYFQFEPAEYLSGDIMFCSYSAQGVFNIIQSLYWQKDCELTLNQIKRRCRDAEQYIQELIDEKIIKLDNDYIKISFLDEQFVKATGKSNKNSEAGKKSAYLRKLRKELNKSLEFISLETNEDLTNLQQTFNVKSTNVDFLLQQISTIKIREEKIREDKKKKKKNNVDVNSYYNIDILKNYYLENDKVINAIINNKDNKLNSREELINRLTEFNDHLIQQKRLSEKFTEYSKYFLNWNRKKKQIDIKGNSKVSKENWIKNPYTN